MSIGGTSPAVVALGIGIALAAAPGPIQAVLLAESVRGGVARGLQALVGVHITFGFLVLSLALGLSVASPHGLALRILRVAGGLFLVWLAFDGVRSKGSSGRAANRRGLPPTLRGALAIVLNPGGWLFLGAVASPLFVTATQRGGTGGAVLTAGALVAGAGLGDLALVLVGGLGLRSAGEQVGRYVRLILATILAVLGLWLLLSGVVG